MKGPLFSGRLELRNWLFRVFIEHRIDANLREERKMIPNILEDVSPGLTTALSEGKIFDLLGFADLRNVHREDPRNVGG
jgi:hypothetical protein